MSQQYQNLGIDPNYVSQYQWPPPPTMTDGGGLGQLGTLIGISSMADGKKPPVVCAGLVTEAKDLDDAQHIAEEQAHQKSANAYILKPVKQVAPKRDVVTTDL